jgi:peptide/nickel transport system ATP-binding protein
MPSITSPPRVKLPTISGSIPHPFNRPIGCPFHPRCASFQPGRCDTAAPRLVAVGDGRQASCFLYQ